MEITWNQHFVKLFQIQVVFHLKQTFDRDCTNATYVSTAQCRKDEAFDNPLWHILQPDI